MINKPTLHLLRKKTNKKIRGGWFTKEKIVVYYLSQKIHNTRPCSIRNDGSNATSAYWTQVNWNRFGTWHVWNVPTDVCIETLKRCYVPFQFAHVSACSWWWEYWFGLDGFLTDGDDGIGNAQIVSQRYILKQYFYRFLWNKIWI